MEDTQEDLAELATDILTEGIDVFVRVGPKETVQIIMVATVTSTVTWLTLSTLSVLAKRALAKTKTEAEQS